MDYLITFVLLVLSGMFSGLTIGLSSLSKDDLERASALGDHKATKVLSVIKDNNLLLVTLLLGNTAVNSTLSVFLGSVVGAGVIAVLVSTAFILVFGEILPAALLTKHALNVGAKTTPLIKFLMKLFYPIAKPIAMTLDVLLGKDLPSFFTRKELVYIIDQHQKSKNSDIDEQDSRIIKGVLSLSSKTTSQHMTNMENVVSINSDKIIDGKLLDKIRISGHTRIPVMKDNIIIGVINSKNLIGLDSELENKVSVIDIMRSDKILISKSTDKLDDLYALMVSKKIHIASVFEGDKNIGIITMEDIQEEILQKEIFDETD